MGRKSKKLTVTIHGETTSDLTIALEEVKRMVEKGYGGGLDSNDTGDYHFDIEKEEVNKEDEEDEK